MIGHFVCRKPCLCMITANRRKVFFHSLGCETFNWIPLLFTDIDETQYNLRKPPKENQMVEWDIVFRGPLFI